MKHRVRNLLGLLVLTAAIAGLAATPALAAPQLGVTLESDSGTPSAEFPIVHHSDERVDFTVKVNNPAASAASEGDQLSCKARRSDWINDSTIHYSFEFEWVRDGAAVTAWAPGSALEGGAAFRSTYTVGAADQEHAIQCLVKGTNGAGTGSYVVASQPVIVVNPQPAVAPPTPNEPTGAPRRPEISGSAKNAGEKLKCTAPTAGWSTSNAISPITWSFEWIRDGGPALGTVTPVSATESEYELTAADVSAPAAPAVFQCIAKATNAGGHPALVESFLVPTTAPAPEFGAGEGEFPLPFFYELPSVNLDTNTTAGPVTLELELPGGEETFAYKTEPESWTCDKLPASGTQPARALCSREDLLRPGEEYPTLKVITALGADAPDIATAKATVFGGSAGVASDELTFPIEPAIPFGIPDGGFTAALLDEEGHDYTQAGGHPFAGISDLVLNQKRALVTPEPLRSPYLPIAQLRQLIVDVPRGVVGNQLALPELCPSVEEVRERKCPPGSAVGGILFRISEGGGSEAIYAIEPEFGAPAQFAFLSVSEDVVTFTPHLRAGDGYAVSLEVAPPLEVEFLGSTTTLCDFGFNGFVDHGTPSDPELEAVCKEAGEPGANPKPLFTTPTRCGVPLTTRVQLNSWADPTFIEGPPFANATIEGCGAVPFEPQANLQPTNHQADSPTGLDVEVSMPTEGLEKGDECHEKQGDESSPLAAECISESHLREAKVTFPEGMAVNPTAGQGLGACAADQIKLGTNDPITCPESSRIGSVEVDTPVLKETLKGSVYIAKQGEVEGSLIGFYLVFDSPKNGILVKLPAKVTPDPNTGRLVVTVAESPQQPFSAVRMHFPGGPRATLLTPPKCGTYQIHSELVPWSGGAPVEIDSPFEVNQGPNGGPCPTGALAAKLNAGTENPVAGKPSPFVFRLSREDGTGIFTGIKAMTPKGLTAKLAGVPYCPDSTLAAISAAEGTGRLELEHPACPAASKVGRVLIGAGAGPEPLYPRGAEGSTGRVYLAGPYKGAPISLVAVTPAVAGPLDLGTVVVRNAVYVDPESAQVSVVSDPVPTIIHGILPDIRDIRLIVDRENFTLNPTNCEPMAVNADVSGVGGQKISLSNRFQVGGCENLAFKPKLSLRLKGGTKRGRHPALRAEVDYPEGGAYANIKSASVALPHSAFLEQAHIRTVCTRVQFAAHECPAGSIYGRARAITPLLDYPLEGPVYLRSSDNKLPDLVVALRGPDSQPIEVALDGRVDSVHGGIRSSFEVVPDAPVSRFVLEMRGGKKGLIVNSTDLCASVNRATAKLSAQNGLRDEFRPPVTASGCAKADKKHHKRHKRHGRR